MRALHTHTAVDHMVDHVVDAAPCCVPGRDVGPQGSHAAVDHEVGYAVDHEVDVAHVLCARHRRPWDSKEAMSGWIVRRLLGWSLRAEAAAVPTIAATVTSGTARGRVRLQGAHRRLDGAPASRALGCMRLGVSHRRTGPIGVSCSGEASSGLVSGLSLKAFRLVDVHWGQPETDIVC